MDSLAKDLGRAIRRIRHPKISSFKVGRSLTNSELAASETTVKLLFYAINVTLLAKSTTRLAKTTSQGFFGLSGRAKVSNRFTLTQKANTLYSLTRNPTM